MLDDFSILTLFSSTHLTNSCQLLDLYTMNICLPKMFKLDFSPSASLNSIENKHDYAIIIYK